MTEEQAEYKLHVWNKLKQPPETALKPIAAGRLKGKTDINPQWRYQAMTEQFGPCGDGWKYKIDRIWTEPGPDGQVFAFAQVLVYIKIGNQGQPLPDSHWSDPIPGVGGSMLIAKEKAGLYANDEAYKMAITDALSVALKMVGVAADIYLGRWEGGRYVEGTTVEYISVDQAITINDLLLETQTKTDKFLDVANAGKPAPSVETIAKKNFDWVWKQLNKKKELQFNKKKELQSPREPGLDLK